MQQKIFIWVFVFGPVWSVESLSKPPLIKYLLSAHLKEYTYN